MVGKVRILRANMVLAGRTVAVVAATGAFLLGGCEVGAGAAAVTVADGWPYDTAARDGGVLDACWQDGSWRDTANTSERPLAPTGWGLTAVGGINPWGEPLPPWVDRAARANLSRVHENRSDEAAPVWPHLHAEAGFVVVERDTELGTAALAGEPRVIERGDTTRVGWGVEADRVPLALRALEGERLRLYDGTTPVCEATAGPLELQTRFATPWYDAEEGVVPLDDGELAVWAWGHELSQPMLVVGLRDVKGDCAAATWARSASLPEPTMARAREPVGAEEQAWVDEVVRRTRALPEWRDTQNDYRQAQADPEQRNFFREVYPERLPKRWDELEPAQVTVVRGAGEAWVLVSMTAGAGCGEFGGSVETLWRVVPGANPKRPLILQRGVGGWLGLELLGGADLDGDGEWELLLPSGLLRGTLDGVDQIEVPREFECPC
jgi:hypothetical protein